MPASKIFHVECQGETLVVAPLGNVSSLDGEFVAMELQAVLEEFGHEEFRNLVVDFQQTAYFGTSMLGAMHALWRVVRQRGGKMAICNLSEVGREVLRVSRFDTVWPICGSLAEALEAVKGEVGGREL